MSEKDTKKTTTAVKTTTKTETKKVDTPEVKDETITTEENKVDTQVQTDTPEVKDETPVEKIIDETFEKAKEETDKKLVEVNTQVQAEEPKAEEPKAEEPKSKEGDDAEIERILKEEHYFSFSSCGRHILNGEYDEVKLKLFYEEFKSSDILFNKNHYDLLNLLKSKF